jgi:hypothetical protein
MATWPNGCLHRYYEYICLAVAECVMILSVVLLCAVVQHSTRIICVCTKCPFFYFRRVNKITKSHYYLRHAYLSVRLHGTTPLPLKGFELHLIYEHF